MQPSDALGATDSLAQRTLPRSASKHPDCRSRAGAGVDHADHVAAEFERHQPPPGRGRDCWFVANAATKPRLPLAVEGSHADEADVSEGIDDRTLFATLTSARHLSQSPRLSGQRVESRD